MGTYLNHQVTFIFSEDESYWASQLDESSTGWCSDDDDFEVDTAIRHSGAHEDYLRKFGPRLSKCGRVLQINSGMYGSYNLSTWTIPDTLIAIVSQWDNTQCSDCFLLKTIPAAEVADFDWFPGAYRDEYLGSFIGTLQPKGEFQMDGGQWAAEDWGIWASMNEAAVMTHLPLDIELPLQLVPLSEATIGPVKKVSPPFKPQLASKCEKVDGYTFVLTGKVEGFTRAKATELLQLHGGTVLPKVKEGVDVLLVGEKAGSKLKEAEALGIQVENAADLLAQLKDFNGNN